MLVSDSSFSYDKIQNQEIQNKAFETENAYYANVYSIEDEESVNSFVRTEGLTLSEKEYYKLTTMTSDNMAVYFFVQIPAGYKAYKRNNVQGTVIDDEKVLLTDNFYYYGSRKNLLYCQVDIKKDETVTGNYVYGFYYELSNVFAKNISNDNIRVLYNLDTSENSSQS